MTVIIMAAAALLAGSVAADAGRIEGPLVNVRIGSAEASMMQEYYRDHPVSVVTEASPKKLKKLPPGLRKKAARGKALPPGWQKKIARGEVMDRDVYAHAQPLPVDLARRLPPQPSGVVTVHLEGKIVRLAAATLIILDVFDILR